MCLFCWLCKNDTITIEEREGASIITGCSSLVNLQGHPQPHCTNTDSALWPWANHRLWTHSRSREMALRSKDRKWQKRRGWGKMGVNRKWWRVWEQDDDRCSQALVTMLITLWRAVRLKKRFLQPQEGFHYRYCTARNKHTHISHTRPTILQLYTILCILWFFKWVVELHILYLQKCSHNQSCKTTERSATWTLLMIPLLTI